MPPGNDKHVMSDLISTCEWLQRQNKTHGYQQKLWKHSNTSWHEKEERHLTELMFHSAVDVSHVRATAIPADYYRLIRRFLSSDPWALHIKQTADMWDGFDCSKENFHTPDKPAEANWSVDKGGVVHSLLHQELLGWSQFVLDPGVSDMSQSKKSGTQTCFSRGTEIWLSGLWKWQI